MRHYSDISVIAYHILKRVQRENWEYRMHSNLDRWRSSLDRLKSARNSVSNNIDKNEGRLKKSKNFLSKVTSGNAKEWYDRSLIKIQKFQDPKKNAILQDMVRKAKGKVHTSDGAIREFVRSSKESVQLLEKHKEPMQKIDDLIGKVKKHQEMISSSEGQIGRLINWISEGNSSLREIDEKISNVRGKISDVEYKLS